MSNYDMIMQDVKSLMHSLSERVILRTAFKVLYYACGCVIAVALFFCLVGIPGQSDFETVSRIAGAEAHSTMFFVLCELAGVLVIAIAWALMKVFDYLIYIQNTHIFAYREQIEQGLSDLEFEVSLIEQRADALVKKNQGVANDLMETIRRRVQTH